MASSDSEQLTTNSDESDLSEVERFEETFKTSSQDDSDGNRNAKGKVPSGRFSQQLENRPPTAAPKHKKPYVRAFQEMRKLQRTTKLCISKYQMAR